MRSRYANVLLASFCLLLLAGCGGASEPAAPVAAQDPAARDSVLALLGTLDEAPFRAAFSGLPEHAYTRYVRTLQRDAENQVLGAVERRIRYTPGAGYEVLEADTSGAFDFGYLSTFVGADDGEAAPEAFLGAVLPEDPAYLAPRNRDAFLYQLRPDTTLWGRTARVIEIRARPGEGDAQPIRAARLYLDRASRALVGFELTRAGEALVSGEATRLAAHLRPASDGSWRPHLVQIRTRYDGPFRAPQHFQTVSAYYDYD